MGTAYISGSHHTVRILAQGPVITAVEVIVPKGKGQGSNWKTDVWTKDLTVRG